MLKKQLFAFTLFILLSACASSAQPTGQASSQSQVQQATATTKPVETATDAPTAESTPPAGGTATPTVSKPDLSILSIENAASLAEEAILGDGTLTDVSMTPDQAYAAYSSTVGVRMLAFDTLTQLAFIESTSAVNSLDFSPDGKYLVTGSDDGYIRIYPVADLAAGSTKPSQEIQASAVPVTQIQFAASGEQFVSASIDRTVISWNVANGKKLHTFAGFDADLTDAAWSPDTRFIAVTSEDGNLRIWDTQTGYLWREYSVDQDSYKTIYPTSVVFDASTGRLFSGWSDGRLLVWQWQFGDDAPLTILLGDEQIIDLIQPTQDSLISLDDGGKTIVWKTNDSTSKTGVSQTSTTDLGKQAVHIEVGTTSQEWLVGSTPAVVAVYDTESAQVVRSYTLPDAGSTPLSGVSAWQDDLWITASQSGKLQVWNLNSNTLAPLEITLNGQVNSLARSGNGDWLAVAIGEEIDLYRMADLQAIYNGTTSADSFLPAVKIQTGGTVTGIAISADGSMLASITDGARAISLWKTADGSSLANLSAAGQKVTRVAFAADANNLASGSTSHMIYVWNGLDAGNVSDSDAYTKAFPFSSDLTSLNWSDPSSQLIITGTGNQANAQNASTFKVVNYINGAAKGLSDAAYSPDGSLLVTVGPEGVLRVYNAQSGKLVKTLTGHVGGIDQVGFTSTGDRIVTLGADGTLRVWSVVK
jgi:WD40 repeat protein